MDRSVAIIGFGEAGSTFAGAPEWRARTRAFDVAPERATVMRDCGVEVCGTLEDALAGVSLAISLVTADQALAVAQAAAGAIAPGTVYCDCNSVAPATKRAAAAAIESAGSRYVDVAVMAPVGPQKLSVPLLLSGAAAAGAAERLAAAGFTSLRVVGPDIGRASTIKMLRSVMYKGMEALTAECLIACAQADVTEEVLASFGNDWASGADYRLDRMLAHGIRRAAELREVCATLEGLGIDPVMSRGTVAWEQRLGDLVVGAIPEGLDAKLALIAARETEGVMR